ncbi:MAG TPA: hypothetical protein VG248_17330 [Caulobacteraceae bacterium]|jgi:hypothetical protein|nr:hypothetical protein [Caulobacteraceae bacterium]
MPSLVQIEAVNADGGELKQTVLINRDQITVLTSQDSPVGTLTNISFPGTLYFTVKGDPAEVRRKYGLD